MWCGVVWFSIGSYLLYGGLVGRCSEIPWEGFKEELGWRGSKGKGRREKGEGKREKEKGKRKKEKGKR